jgi:K+-transporting ATPase KdpF subunit
MSFDMILGAAVSVFLLVFFVAALLLPEKF